MNTKKQVKVVQALEKIRAVFPASPEGLLAFAVTEQAVKDLTSPASFTPDARGKCEQNKFALRHQTALNYLRGSMFWAMNAGVEPGYIRLVLKNEGGLSL